MESLEKIFQSFEKIKVLIIGDVMLDSYIWGSVERISPEAPVPIVHVRKRDVRLGGAANVALNIQSLGATPILVALRGNDDAGQRLHTVLEQQNMTAEGMVVSYARPTTVKTRVIASHQHVVRVDEESDRVPDLTEEKLLWEKIEKLLPQCQVVIFEDYDKGVLNESIIAKTVKLSRSLNIPTVVDPKKRNFLAYREVSLFKPNLKEMREGLKIELEPGNQSQLENGIKLLKEKLKIEGVMATLSEHGIYLDFQHEKVKLSAYPREIADVSGAGDTVVSIAALGVAVGLPPKRLAALSNLGGGLVCQYVGVVPIKKEELLEEAKKESV
jgi:D-glycero-beta-D-manno-heptose-7-phosphate kinase